jgi:hypothetical protein
VNQKATGIATVEATITGNRSDCAPPTPTGNDLEFGGQSALQLASVSPRMCRIWPSSTPTCVDDERDVAIVGGQTSTS